MPTIMPLSVSRRLNLLWRDFAGRCRSGLGEPFEELPVTAAPTADVRTGGRDAGAVAVGGMLIGPNSAVVERHQFQVAEQLQAGNEVRDLNLVQLVLVLRHAALGGQ